MKHYHVLNRILKPLKLIILKLAIKLFYKKEEIAKTGSNGEFSILNQNAVAEIIKGRVVDEKENLTW
jgi:iron complex outermembrane receptor protein